MNTRVNESDTASTDIPSANYAHIATHFDTLKNAVLNKRPVLKSIIEKHGKKSLNDYSQDYTDANPTPAIARREEFLQLFGEEVARLLGDTVAATAVTQLKKYFFVSTADHHGPVCHPFFLNADMIIGTSYDGRKDDDLKQVIVLSCANVSLNNSSFPRGLLFNTVTPAGVEMHRLSFLPSNCHAAAVYNFLPYHKEDIEKLRKVIKEKLKNGLVTETVATKLNTILTEIYDTEEIYALKNYADQISVTNYHLWKQYLKTSDLPRPDLIYIEQETLVTKLLLRHHLHKETTISKIIFDPSSEELINKYFEGIMGAFSRKEGWGTYMFWGLAHGGHDRLHLWKKGNRLVSDNGAVDIELTPEAIEKALEEKLIMPSMMLIFMVLAFYYGLKCLGGVNQVNYLTLLKEAYIKMQTEKNDLESVEACRDVQTKEFVDGPTITFLKGPKGEVVPAAGLDLILYGEKNTWRDIISFSKDITLEEAFYPLLPEYYPVMYPEVERVPELSKITSEEIAVYTGIIKKIKPCVTIT